MPEFAQTLKVGLDQSLKDSLAQRIRHEGPISFHDWMKSALYESTRGYYCRSDLKRWGREGDYRTSPERSDLFAATFTRYFSELHERLGRPSHFTILECGAGDGSFALGVLSNLRERFPELFAISEYVIDEISHNTRMRIKKTLSGFEDKVTFVTLDEITPLPDSIVFSNELLDAFPVHRLTMTEGRVRELYISLNDNGDFVWTVGEISSVALGALWHRSGIRLSEGQIIEINPGIDDWFERLGRKLSTGYVVTVDYGSEADDLYNFDLRPQGTLRAYSRHKFVDNVLDSPGDYDITASINWSQVRESGNRQGFRTEEFSRLDQFLLKTGVLESLEQPLGKCSGEADRLRLTTAAREMILPGGMASSFQVLVQSRE